MTDVEIPPSVDHVPGPAGNRAVAITAPHAEPDVTTWALNVLVFAYPTSVNARAELRLGGATVYGHGHFEWCPPGGPDVSDVGRRMAVSRALHDLADTMAFAAGNDIAGLRARAHLAHPASPDPE